VLFSEPKIPQCRWCRWAENLDKRFSALQRAENSSIWNAIAIDVDTHRVSVLFSEPKIPQSSLRNTKPQRIHRFSALQRAENSSMLGKSGGYDELNSVSVLFSEPKIPQSIGRIKLPKLNGIVSVLFSEPKIPQWRRVGCGAGGPDVSVLFSEPKIPQWCCAMSNRSLSLSFSALQRAENSSISRRQNPPDR